MDEFNRLARDIKLLRKVKGCGEKARSWGAIPTPPVGAWATSAPPLCLSFQVGGRPHLESVFGLDVGISTLNQVVRCSI